MTPYLKYYNLVALMLVAGYSMSVLCFIAQVAFDMNHTFVPMRWFGYIMFLSGALFGEYFRQCMRKYVFPPASPPRA